MQKYQSIPLQIQINSHLQQVTAQIWRTLYDYPSLKTCVRFNRFILDCVNTVWLLYVGDGNGKRCDCAYSYIHKLFSSDTRSNTKV